MYVLECEIVTPAPISEVFAVFENPYNLAKITPPWLGFRILTNDVRMRSGAEIDYQFRWLGLPMTWKTEITQYDAPTSFVDEARRSPYTYWRHRHTFRETAGGTIVGDRVEYDLPFGAFGRVAHRLAVSHQLKRIFEYRQKAIVQLLGGDLIEVRPPRIEMYPDN
jgi:ligand-binding SRPBCC domain-containing protein